ncbi:MAG: DEAD/DEAH box helicase [Chlamydiales bacterium]|nr:DEAD/DEAH box helicase [Chlamydiales bacterium]
MSFTDLGLHHQLLESLEEMGFTTPTQIQQEIIPHIIDGRDVIASSQTGTGKTAAFLLPTLHRLLQEKKKGIRALIVSPTRELALQSADFLKNLSKKIPLRSIALFGGVPLRPQIQGLRRGVDIVFATPGRLLDHIEQQTLSLSLLDTLILDEADRMMDMGFLPDIKRIISLLPAKRQNLIFSATMPPEIMKLAKDMVQDPITVCIGSRSSTPSKVRQTIYPVIREQKTELFLKLLEEKKEISSAIVFTRTKMGADRLADSLEEAGIKTSVIHGDRSQAQRSYALLRFKQGKSQILVATDVAARGIDVKDVSHVVNYDAPSTPEDYIHRIGRTARADTTGDAFSFIAPDEEAMLRSIEKEIRLQIPRIFVDNFEYKQIPHKRPSRRGPRGNSHFHNQERKRSSPPSFGERRRSPSSNQGESSYSNDQRPSSYNKKPLRKPFRQEYKKAVP